MKKIFSVLIAVLLLISCCALLASCGGKDATVSEEEWKKALSESAFTYDGKINVTVKFVEGDAEFIVYFADGKCKEGTEAFDCDFEYFMKTEVGTALEFANLFANFEYDEKSESYVFLAEDDEEKFELKFADGKLSSLKITIEPGTEDEESFAIYYYDYGKTEINLPPVDNTVTADEWRSALQIGDTPYHVLATVKVEENGYTATMEQKYADGKIMMIESYAGGFAIDYMERAEGGHWFYNDETEAETVEAERVYTKRFVSFEDTEGEDEFEDTVNGPKRMFLTFVDTFDSFTYDEERGAYFADELLEADLTNITLVFEDGKITFIKYTTEGATYSIEVSFDNVSVTLPEV